MLQGSFSDPAGSRRTGFHISIQLVDILPGRTIRLLQQLPCQGDAGAACCGSSCAVRIPAPLGFPTLVSLSLKHTTQS